MHSYETDWHAFYVYSLKDGPLMAMGMNAGETAVVAGAVSMFVLLSIVLLVKRACKQRQSVDLQPTPASAGGSTDADLPFQEDVVDSRTRAGRQALGQSILLEDVSKTDDFSFSARERQSW